MNRNLKALVIAALFISSCSKSDSSTTPPPTSATPASGVIHYITYQANYDVSYPAVSDTFKYNTAGIITGLNRSQYDEKRVFTYSGTNITRIDGKGNPPSTGPMTFIHQLHYSGSQLDSIIYQPGTNSEEVRRFTYAASKLATKELAGDVDTYTYDAAGNLVKVSKSYKGSQWTQSYQFTYNSTPNLLASNTAFRDMNKVTFFVEFMDMLAFSPNQCTAITHTIYDASGVVNKTTSYVITYDLSSNGYPVNIYCNGVKLMSFVY